MSVKNKTLILGIWSRKIKNADQKSATFFYFSKTSKEPFYIEDWLLKYMLPISVEIGIKSRTLLPINCLLLHSGRGRGQGDLPESWWRGSQYEDRAAGVL